MNGVCSPHQRGQAHDGRQFPGSRGQEWPGGLGAETQGADTGGVVERENVVDAPVGLPVEDMARITTENFFRLFAKAA